MEDSVGIWREYTRNGNVIYPQGWVELATIAIGHRKRKGGTRGRKTPCQTMVVETIGSVDCVASVPDCSYRQPEVILGYRRRGECSIIMWCSVALATSTQLSLPFNSRFSFHQWEHDPCPRPAVEVPLGDPCPCPHPAVEVPLGDAVFTIAVLLFPLQPTSATHLKPTYLSNSTILGRLIYT
jgi:hypothetical protein